MTKQNGGGAYGDVISYSKLRTKTSSNNNIIVYSPSRSVSSYKKGSETFMNNLYYKKFHNGSPVYQNEKDNIILLIEKLPKDIIDECTVIKRHGKQYLIGMTNGSSKYIVYKPMAGDIYYYDERLEITDKVWFRSLLTLFKFVDACFNVGILHRDIKPHNILFDYLSKKKDYEIRIGDFGEVTELYHIKYLTGTPNYIYYYSKENYSAVSEFAEESNGDLIRESIINELFALLMTLNDIALPREYEVVKEFIQTQLDNRVSTPILFIKAFEDIKSDNCYDYWVRFLSQFIFPIIKLIRGCPNDNITLISLEELDLFLQKNKINGIFYDDKVSLFRPVFNGAFYDSRIVLCALILEGMEKSDFKVWYEKYLLTR